MNYNFTDLVRKSLALAREEALRLRHDYVGQEHLFLGLLRLKEQGVAFQILVSMNVDTIELTERVEQGVRRGKTEKDISGLPYTSHAKKALEYAVAEARELGNSYVGTEHLLLGLLRLDIGLVVDALASVGVTLENARDRVREFQVQGRAEAPEYVRGPPSRREQPTGHDAIIDDAAQVGETDVHEELGPKPIDTESLVIIADLDALPVSFVAEFMGTLDHLHRSLGGAGLRLDREYVGKAALSRIRT